MTEIKFLLDLILNEKLPKSAKDKCLSRIGEIEETLLKTPIVPQRQPLIPGIQAPSTQRLMEQHVAPVVGPIMVPQGKIDKETGSVMVNNGDGTTGKRKW